LLLATGPLGVLPGSTPNSAIEWMARTGVLLSSVYMIIAAAEAAQQSNAWEISLTVKPHDARLGYALAIVFVAAAIVVRLAFLQNLGMRAPYLLFYPALVLAALYGGRGPGILATVLAGLAAHLLWIEPIGRIRLHSLPDMMSLGIFLAT